MFLFPAWIGINLRPSVEIHTQRHLTFAFSLLHNKERLFGINVVTFRIRLDRLFDFKRGGGARIKNSAPRQLSVRRIDVIAH